jgi:hypothetical protein
MLAPAQLYRCGHEPKAAALSTPKSILISSKRYATTAESTNGTINLIADFTPENTDEISATGRIKPRMLMPA